MPIFGNELETESRPPGKGEAFFQRVKVVKVSASTEFTHMKATHYSLDLSRLEKVRYSGDKIIARCPACAESEGDRKGNHLCIFPTGKYACAAMPGDREHSRRISVLAGTAGEREHEPAQERAWRERRAIEHREAEHRQSLIATIQEKRSKIIARHSWALADVWEDSPQRVDCDLVEFDPRHFLSTLFPQDAIVWAGKVFHSGCGNGNHWRTVADWQNETTLGPMTTPSIWKPSITKRIRENVLCAPYVVLDFDGFDGIKPKKPEEIEKNRFDSLAMVRWIREGLDWKLAAIVWTGSKSIHAWFHSPPPAVLQSMRDCAIALGIDPGLIGRPEHPCRLPGQQHEKTGDTSRLLWLQLPWDS